MAPVMDRWAQGVGTLLMIWDREGEEFPEDTRELVRERARFELNPGRPVPGTIAVSLISVDVRNRTDRMISGTRLRVKHVTHLREVTVSGRYLTDAEAEAHRELVEFPASPFGDLVLPELPPIPAGGSVTVSLYGDMSAVFLYSGIVEVTVEDATVEVQEVAPVRKTMMVRFVTDRITAFPILVFAVPMVLLVVSGAVYGLALFYVRKHPTWATYETACVMAKSGRGDLVMHMLQLPSTRNWGRAKPTESARLATAAWH